jgi:hypothetical protein
MKLILAWLFSLAALCASGVSGEAAQTAAWPVVLTSPPRSERDSILDAVISDILTNPKLRDNRALSVHLETSSSRWSPARITAFLGLNVTALGLPAGKFIIALKRIKSTERNRACLAFDWTASSPMKKALGPSKHRSWSQSSMLEAGRT